MKKVHIIITALILCMLIIFNGCSTNTPAENEKQETGTVAQETQKETSGTQGALESAVNDTVIEPDQLISKEEAETLLGTALMEGEKKDNAVVGQKLCFYDAEDESSDSFLQICITQQSFMPEGSPNTPESIYQTTKDAFGGDSAVVEGPGDETILVTGGYYILCNGYMLQISVGNTDEEAMIAILNAASEVAVNNLKALID